MTSKCRKIEQITAVMEMARVRMISGAGAALAVGATTSSATTHKRRKLNSDEHLKFTAGSSFVQHNSRSPINSQPEKMLLPPPKSEARCNSLHTDVQILEGRLPRSGTRRNPKRHRLTSIRPRSEILEEREIQTAEKTRAECKTERLS